MKLLYSTILLCVLVATTKAITARGYYKDPNYPDKCVLKGVVLSPGEEAQEQYFCGRMVCGKNSLVTFHSCGVKDPREDNYKGFTMTPKGPYPECCKKKYIRLN